MGNNQSLFTARIIECSSIKDCISILTDINLINNLEKNKINGNVYDYVNNNNNNNDYYYYRSCINYKTNIKYLEKITIDNNNNIIRIELINNIDNNTNYTNYITEYEIIQKNSTECLLKCRIQYKFKRIKKCIPIFSGLIASYLCCCITQYYSETDCDYLLDSIEKGLMENKMNHRVI